MSRLSTKQPPSRRALGLRPTRVALAVGAAVLAAQAAFAQGQPRADRPELFAPVPAAQVTRLSDVPAAKRQRNVALDLSLLRDDGTRPRIDGLTFSLFEDAVVSGRLRGVEAAYGGGYVVALDLDQGGHAYLSVVGDSVTGTFRAGDRLYQLHCVADGQHTVSEIDELRQPPCGTANPAPGGVRALWGPPIAATLYEVIDMLVVYTDDARTSYGTNGIHSLVNLAVFETNQGYAQSDVNLRLNLVLAREVTFTESGGIATWVSQLRNVDGVIDEVHQWRDAYGADAVCMITNDGGGFCGMAYNVMTVLSPAGANDAFNVTAAGCATGNYSFGHELGHSLGCQHDRANTGGGALYPYCYGYRTASQAYRTIMAYAPGTRLNIWSNPSKRAPNGEVLGAVNTEENWRVLNNVASVVTGWRGHKNVGAQVKTTFASNNGFAGNMFNVYAKDDIEITSIDINSSAATSTIVSANVWFRLGSYATASTTQAGWCLLGTGTAPAAGQDRGTRLDLGQTPTLRAGDTYGIYVEYLSYGGAGGLLRYTNGSPTVYENNYLKITTGIGKGVGFAAAPIADRIWNGRIRYRGGSGTGSLTTTFATNNQFAGNLFTVTPTKSLTVNSFDVHVAGAGYVSVDVWYRTGSYVGFEGNASGWTFVGSELKAQAAGQGLPTRITVGDVDLTAGTTYSFYLLLSSYGASGQSLLYSNGSTAYSNADLAIGGGAGTDDAAFSGNVFPSRIWNGTIYYTLAASLSTFGTGCAGSAGVPVHKATGLPHLGSTVTYTLSNGPANGIGYIVLGNSSTAWLGLVLPADLGVIGAPGCKIYCDHDVVLGPIALSPAGTVNFPISIASICGLTGAHLYTQFLLFDRRANALGITTSNAVDALIGQ